MPEEPQLRQPLVASLLTGLIADAGSLAMQAHALLSPVADRKSDLRTALLGEGQIIRFDAATPATVSLAAVDGGSVKETLYAADLLIAVGASASGMHTDETIPLGHRHFTVVRQHVSENDRLLSAAMASLELCLLAELVHDLRILDGSHTTPIIALSTALAARDPQVAAAAAELVTDEVIAAVAALADPRRRPTGGNIVALPKADSSHAFTDLYRRRYGLDLPGGDRFMAAQVLEPGEMLYPRPAAEITQLHFPIADDAAPAVRKAATALDRAVSPLRDAAQQRRLLVSYLKPTSADTVIKMEFRVSEPLIAPGEPGVPVDEAADLAKILSDETPGPFMQEPFAQYAVDVAAKSVSVGANAVKEAMLGRLPDGGAGYASLLARSYRTASVKPAAPAPR